MRLSEYPCPRPWFTTNTSIHPFVPQPNATESTTTVPDHPQWSGHPFGWPLTPHLSQAPQPIVQPIQRHTSAIPFDSQPNARSPSSADPGQFELLVSNFHRHNQHAGCVDSPHPPIQ